MSRKSVQVHDVCLHCGMSEKRIREIVEAVLEERRIKDAEEFLGQ